MTRSDAVLIADAAGLSIFALGRDREKFLLALEIFTTMVEAAERRKLEGQIETLDEMYKLASRQRDELMDQQRAQVEAMLGRIQLQTMTTSRPTSGPGLT
jgi:hypothetical protein